MSRTPQNSLARSSAVMFAGTLTSRILGFVRNALLAVALGATASGAADAFNTANALPTQLYNLLIGGILNAVLVPQIVRALRQKNGDELVNRLLTAAGTLILAVTVLLTIAAPLVIMVYASGLEAWLPVAYGFAFWCMPQIFFYGLYALWGQVLNARSSFGPYMWSPVLNNIISIASLLAYMRIYQSYQGSETPADWGVARIALVAGTATLGIVIQAVVLYLPLRRIGFRPRVIFGVRGIGLGQTSKVASWALLGVFIASLGDWATTNLGSLAVTAAREPAYAGVVVPSTTMYANALLVYMLPQSLVTTSIITALFTRMSEKAAAGDGEGVRDDLSLGLRSVAVFTMLASAGIVVLSAQALQAFVPSISTAEAVGSAPVLIALALGIVPQGVWFTTQRVMLAYADTKRLLLADLVAGVTPVVACVVAYFLAPANLWMVGAAVGSSLGLVAASAAIVPLMRRHIPSLDGRRVLSTYLRLGAAALGAAAAGEGVRLLLGPADGSMTGTRALDALVQIAVVATVMTVVYLAVGRVLRVSELSLLFTRLARILALLGRLLPGALGAAVLRASRALDPTTSAPASQGPVAGEDGAATADGAAGVTAAGVAADGTRAPRAAAHAGALPGGARQAADEAAGVAPQATGVLQAAGVPQGEASPPPRTRSAVAPSGARRTGATRATGNSVSAPTGSLPPSIPVRPGTPATPGGPSEGRPPAQPAVASPYAVGNTAVRHPSEVTMGSQSARHQAKRRARMSTMTPMGSGRYALGEALPATLPRIVRHLGVDTILDRDVMILTLTDATPHRAEVLEAAARAVLITDSRVQRVYDVEEGSATFIVTEPPEGVSLAELVRRGVNPAQARTIIGEVASALESASRRGLHHLGLGPDSVRLRRHGQVQVLGLGVDAAVLGREGGVNFDPLAADRTDARGLVSLLYYLLTKRWPGKRSGIPSAPMGASGPVPPSRLDPDWDPSDRDLEALIARTWGGHPPLSAAEVARSLGRWDSRALLPLLPAPDPEPATPQDRPAESFLATTKAVALEAASRYGDPVPVPPRQPAPAQDDAQAPQGTQGAGTQAQGAAPQASATAPPEQLPAQIPPRTRPAVETPYSSPVPPSIPPSAPPAQPEPVAAPPSRPADGRNPTQTWSASQARGAAVAATPERVEDDEESSRSVSRTSTVVLVSLVALVLVGAFFAVSNLLQLANVRLTDDNVPAAKTVPSTATSSTQAPATTSSSDDSTKPTPSSAPVKVAGAKSLSGDHPELESRLTDGDTSKEWFSQWHRDPGMDGGTKSLAVTLEQKATVSGIDIQGTGAGGHVQIRATSPDDPEGGTLLAEGEFTQGTTTFNFQKPTETTTVVLLVTRLPKSSDGENKLTITEITLR